MKWELQYRAHAEADRYASLETFLERLEDAGGPWLGCTKRLVDGTMLVVGACCAYWELDGQTSVAGRFLKSQIYPDGVSNLTGYTLTFDLYGMALARIVIPDGPILADLDLADLYAYPWHEYKRVGYNRLYITRADWGEISLSELKELESLVIQDIRYDFPEDEVDLWFETSPDSTSLMVVLQDIDDED